IALANLAGRIRRGKDYAIRTHTLPDQTAHKVLRINTAAAEVITIMRNLGGSRKGVNYGCTAFSVPPHEIRYGPDLKCPPRRHRPNSRKLQSALPYMKTVSLGQEAHAVSNPRRYRADDPEVRLGWLRCVVIDHDRRRVRVCLKLVGGDNRRGPALGGHAQQVRPAESIRRVHPTPVGGNCLRRVVALPLRRPCSEDVQRLGL